jgi:putative flippase GtrA
MRRLLRPVSLMAAMSLLSFTVNLGLSALLHERLGWSEELAFLIAIAIVLLMNFLACRYLIFDAREGDIRQQAVRFLLSALGFRGAEYGCFLLIHSWLGVQYLVAITGILGVSFGAKFLFFGRFVFQSQLLKRDGGASGSPADASEAPPPKFLRPSL